MKKIFFSICTIIATCFTLTSCDSNQPKLNPQPKYFVTISGNIEPHMQYPMTVIYKATYAAYNPNCSTMINRLEGVQGMPGYSDYYPAKPNSHGDYKVKIPIDKFLPGKCGWEIAWTEFSFQPKLPSANKYSDIWGWNDMIHFGKLGNPQELPGYPITNHGIFYCGKNGIKDCSGSAIIGGYVKYVARNQSYSFTQNIKNNKERS